MLLSYDVFYLFSKRQSRSKSDIGRVKVKIEHQLYIYPHYSFVMIACDHKTLINWFHATQKCLTQIFHSNFFLSPEMHWITWNKNIYSIQFSFPKSLTFLRWWFFPQLFPPADFSPILSSTFPHFLLNKHNFIGSNQKPPEIFMLWHT